MGEYVPQWVYLTGATTTPATSAIRVLNGNVRQNTEITGEDSGGLYHEALSVTKQMPEAAFSTTAIKAVLDNIGLAGTCVGDTFTLTDLDIIARAIGTCDDPLGATPHYRLHSDKGLLRLQNITASRGADAVVSVSYDAFTPDGTNAPWGETDGVAEPATSVSERYRLAACSIAGVNFTEIEGVDLSLNVGITDKEPRVAAIWPATAGVITVRPVLTLRGRNLAKVKLGVLELLANSAAHADTKIQLIRIEDGATYYSAAATQHIAITMAGMAAPEDLMDGGGGSRGNNSITLVGLHDGSNVPVLASTTSTYDATLES